MSELVPDAAVKAIQDGVRVEVIEVGEVLYVTRPVFDPRTPEPIAQPLLVHTLGGLVDWLNGKFDSEARDYAVHVVSHSEVQVIGALKGRFKQRDLFVKAVSESILSKAFQFGTFHDTESFIIALQTLFVQTDELRSILRLVGNLTEESVRTSVDDGVSQTVVAKTGIAKVGNVEVPNPVTLAPYRTFREIEQPSSPFVLRLRQSSNGNLPACALFEADGGAWKLAAIKTIWEFLGDKVEGIQIIA